MGYLADGGLQASTLFNIYEFISVRWVIRWTRWDSDLQPSDPKVLDLSNYCGRDAGTLPGDLKTRYAPSGLLPKRAIFQGPRMRQRA